MSRPLVTMLWILIAGAAFILPVRIEGQTFEAGIAVGYALSALVPSVARGVLPFQPGEDVLVQLSRQARVVLTGPENRVVQDRVIGPTDVPVVLHTFASLDEPSEHRLWVDGELQPLRLLLERRFLNSAITARLALANSTISARIENTRTQLAFFLTRGAPNYLTPRGELTPDFLVQLGLAPRGPFRAEVVLEYPTPIEFQLTDSASTFGIVPIVAAGIVQRTEEILPNGTSHFVDRGLELPALHDVANGGTVPLRYGPARLAIRTQKTIGAPSRVQNGPEIEARIYIVPAGLRNEEALTDEIRLPAEEIVRAPQPQMIGIVGTEQRARFILGELVIPAGLVVVRDVRHDRVVRQYELLANAATAERLDGETAILYDDMIPGNFVFGLISLPTRNVSYGLRVNGFPIRSEPGNLTSHPGPAQVVQVHLVDLTVRVPFVAGQPPPEVRIESALGSYSVLAWNATLSLPPGQYTISARLGERYALLEMELSDDLTVALALPPEPFPALLVLQITALAEAGLLSTFFLLRRRRTLPSSSN